MFNTPFFSFFLFLNFIPRVLPMGIVVRAKKVVCLVASAGQICDVILLFPDKCTRNILLSFLIIDTCSDFTHKLFLLGSYCYCIYRVFK